MTTYYAIMADDDGTLWGCGDSQEAAWKEAKECLGVYEHEDGFSWDNFKAEPMTERFYMHLQESDLVGLRYGFNDDGLVDYFDNDRG